MMGTITPWKPLLCVIMMVLVVPACADAQKKTLVNRLGMEFVLIPAGSFIMGSPSDEDSRNADEIQHQVIITKSFYMQTTEVTVGQWRRLMGRSFKGFFKRRNEPDNIPVNRICFHDVEAFLEKLNALEDGKYRLPTEAEWEYACRAGTQTAYSFGDWINCSLAMFENKVGRFDLCTGYTRQHSLPVNGPAPVKSYPPNPWGLYDMHGNVWEWCLDRHGPYGQVKQVDPAGPSQGAYRIRRGGSWFSQGDKCRSANRAFGHPGSRLRNTGFRVVRVVEP